MIKKLLKELITAIIAIFFLVTVLVFSAFCYHENQNYLLIFIPIISVVVYLIVIGLIKEKYGDEVREDVQREYFRHRFGEDSDQQRIKGFYPFKEYQWRLMTPFSFFSFKKISKHSKLENYYLDEKARNRLICINVFNAIASTTVFFLALTLFGNSKYLSMVLLFCFISWGLFTLRIKNKIIRNGLRESEISVTK